MTQSLSNHFKKPLSTLELADIEQQLMSQTLSRRAIQTKMFSAMQSLVTQVPNFMQVAAQMMQIRMSAASLVTFDGEQSPVSLGALPSLQEPTTLPAIISTELRAAGVRQVAWTDLSDLPGAHVPSILALGLSIFKHFNLKTDAGVRVIANTAYGDLLNDQLDMNAVLHFLQQAAIKVSPENTTLIMGDYRPEIQLYHTDQYAYLVVFEHDGVQGRYIYSFARDVAQPLKQVR